MGFLDKISDAKKLLHGEIQKRGYKVTTVTKSSITNCNYIENICNLKWKNEVTKRLQARLQAGGDLFFQKTSGSLAAKHIRWAAWFPALLWSGAGLHGISGAAIADGDMKILRWQHEWKFPSIQAAEHFFYQEKQRQMPPVPTSPTCGWLPCGARPGEDGRRVCLPWCSGNNYFTGSAG